MRTGVLQSLAVCKWQYKMVQHDLPSWVSRHQCRWSLWCHCPCSKLCYWEIHPRIACLHFPSTPPAGNLAMGFSHFLHPQWGFCCWLKARKKKKSQQAQKASLPSYHLHCLLVPSGKLQEYRAGGQAKDKNVTVSTSVPGTEHNDLLNQGSGHHITASASAQGHTSWAAALDTSAREPQA